MPDVREVSGDSGSRRPCASHPDFRVSSLGAWSQMDRQATIQHFETPFRDMLSDDVKFYAVLGNHDIRRGTENLSDRTYLGSIDSSYRFLILSIACRKLSRI